MTFRAHVDPLKIGFSVWTMMWIQAEPRSIDVVAEQVDALQSRAEGGGEARVDHRSIVVGVGLRRNVYERRRPGACSDRSW